MSKGRLYVVDGVSSVWKQDLVRYFEHVVPNATVVKKFSTRSPRPGEDLSLLDLEFVSREVFSQISPEYIYEYAGERYGLSSGRLRAALEKFRHVFVIARNAEVIRALKRDFEQHGPISVFVHMDVKLAANRSLAIKNPVLREAVRDAFDDYLREPECYDEVLVNGGSRNDFYRLLGLLIKRGGDRVMIVRGSGVGARSLLVLSTNRMRRLIQVVLAVVSTATASVAVNMLTQGVPTYWEKIALVLDFALLGSTLLIQVVLATRWLRRP